MVEELALLARLGLGGVFLAAGLGKCLERRERAIEYHFLPGPLARFHSRLLPYLELLTGLAVLIGAVSPGPWTLRVVPPSLAGGLLVAFILFVALALARGAEVECHCFGRFGGGRVTAWTLARNLTGLALVAIVLYREWRGPARGEISGATLTALALIALAALAIATMAREAVALETVGRAARRDSRHRVLRAARDIIDYGEAGRGGAHA